MATRKKEPTEKKRTGAETPPPDDLSFEEAIGEVEGIVQAMEGDNVPLENLLKSYERGTFLLEVCRRRIDEAQSKIDLITKKGDGELVAEPFDPENPTGANARQDLSDAHPGDAGERNTKADGSSDEIRLF